MNGGRFFLDSNIFVYAFHPDADSKARRARELVRLAGTSGRGSVSYQVVQEFFSVALRKFRPKLPPAEAEYYLLHVFRPLLAVTASLELFGQTLELHRRSQLTWYDALIVAAALQARCSTLYTGDLQHGQQFGSLRVEDPFR
ncbi:MAG: PIN domain-containing protein [Terriglobales bacterium]